MKKPQQFRGIGFEDQNHLPIDATSASASVVPLEKCSLSQEGSIQTVDDDLEHYIVLLFTMCLHFPLLRGLKATSTIVFLQKKILHHKKTSVFFSLT